MKVSAARQAAQRLFGFSILYLFIVFAALLIEARLFVAMDAERHGDPMGEERATVVLSKEQARSRRTRSIAIALALGALVILFYAVTLVKGRRC